MSLMLQRRAMLLGQGTNTGGSSGGSGGGSGGGSSGSGGATSPSGPPGAWTKYYETLFPGTTLPAGWTPGRYTYSTFTSNEGTNIPSKQLDTSYGGNVHINNGLVMSVSPQPDSSQAGTFPFAGSHVSNYSALLTSSSVGEVVMKVDQRGACWPAIVWYVVTPGHNGEIDQAEYGDTWDTLNPTVNAHDANYSVQDQQDYIGAPALVGDGKYHTYTIWRNGAVFSVYLDGVLCGTANRTVFENYDYGLFFELGVYKFSSLGSGTGAIKSFGSVMNISRVTIWH